MISSARNPKLQFVRNLLRNKKTRDENKLFVAEGVRLIEEGLHSGWNFQELFYSSKLGSRGKRIVERYLSGSARVEEVNADIFDSLSATETSQGILAVFEQRNDAIPNQLDFALIADQIRDPGNLGTLMRTAWAGGVQVMLLTAGCVDPFSPKVVRSAMGAHFHIPFRQASIAEMQSFKHKIGSRVIFYAATMNQGSSCWRTDLCGPLALIVGSEAEGITPEITALADRSIHLPMPGGAESLNAAIAGSILVFEVVRQRKK